MTVVDFLPGCVPASDWHNVMRVRACTCVCMDIAVLPSSVNSHNRMVSRRSIHSCTGLKQTINGCLTFWNLQLFMFVQHSSHLFLQASPFLPGPTAPSGFGGTTWQESCFHQQVNSFVLVLQPISNTEDGSAIAPGTSRRLPTTEAQFEPWSNFVDICRVALRRVFSNYSGFPCQLSFQHASLSCRVTGVQSWCSPAPLYEENSTVIDLSHIIRLPAYHFNRNIFKWKAGRWIISKNSLIAFL